jgi:hypothetical protein
VGGANAIVRNTVVANTGPSGKPGDRPAVGIQLTSDGGRVLNNDVHSVTPAGIAEGTGIHLLGGNNTLVVGNRITIVADHGVFFTFTGKYRDNLTSGVGTPFGGGGTDAGGNN